MAEIVRVSHHLEAEMMAFPARTAEELAAKVVCNTGIGDFGVGDGLLAECIALAEKKEASA